MSLFHDLDLDDLLVEAVREQKQRRSHSITREESRKLTAVIAEASTLYSNPENWNPAGSVALLHEESQDLLGFFDSFLHKKIPATRKLVRIPDTDDLPRTYRKEWVSGPEWVTAPRALPTPVSAIELVEILCPLEMEAIHASCHEAGLEIKLVYGGIVTARLTGPAVFRSAGDHPPSFFEFPANLNIYEYLSRETKVLIKKRIDDANLGRTDDDPQVDEGLPALVHGVGTSAPSRGEDQSPD